MLDDTISSLIGRLYDGAGDPERWRAANDQLLDVLGARFLLAGTVAPARCTMLDLATAGDVGGRVDDAIAEYGAGMRLTDPSFAFMARRPGARLFDAALHVAPDDLDGQEHRRWRKARGGIAHWLVGFTPGADGTAYAMSLNPIVDEPAGAPQRRLFALLFDHAARARRLAAERAFAVNAPDALIEVDAAGRIARMNAAAERLLLAADGLAACRGALEPSDRSARPAFARALAAALAALAEGGSGGAVSLARPSGRPALLAMVEPCPAPATAGVRARAIVRVIDPAAQPPSTPARWRDLWRLTPAEILLCETLLAADGDLRDAAERIGAGYATVRTQLASIFAKTGVAGQPALMRLLVRTVV